MDRRSWLWRRKSSEKSPGETESTGSVSSLSERFSDDQRSQSPELISKPEIRDEETTADIKILTERLSAALLDVSLKENLAKQHAKVAEEAVSGWEKAENEAAALKEQLDASTNKISALEDRNSHLDSALKECVRQLWQGREEQNQKIEEAINKKRQEWEARKSELEAQIEELQARLQTGEEEVMTASIHKDLYPKLEALVKENSATKLQLRSKAEEVKIRTIERDLSIQAAESASKQQLEGIKKLAKVEAECRKLRVMVQRSVNSGELKSSSVDNQSDYSGRVSFSDNEMQSPSKKITRKTSMAPSVEIDLMDDFLEMEKLASLPHSEPGRKQSESNKELEKVNAQSSQLKHELKSSLHMISELEEKVEMVEVEKLQLEMALNESKEQIEALQRRLMETEGKLSEIKKLEVENHDLELLVGESEKQIHDLQRQLNKTQVNLSELETTRADKLELTICLNGTKKQFETSQNRLKETERKLAEFQSLLHLTKGAKEAAEDSVKAANAKTEAVESKLRDVEAESESLILKIESLEESTEKERALSAKHISRCEELQDEISKLKHELEHHQQIEAESMHMKGFDENFKQKQEKELAAAASKFAECQRTIASLGQRLQSVATFEDFLIDS